MNINKATLCGRITKDLEVKSLSNGNKVLSFGLATNRNWKDQQGTKHEDATFHNIIAFGKQAEVKTQYCAKGDELYIEGRIQNRTYDKQDGSKAYVSEVVLQNFQFGQKKEKKENTGEDLKEISGEDLKEISGEDVDMNGLELENDIPF